jgi:hypothetical protein
VNRWRNWMPCLDLRLDLGFVWFETEVMYYNDHLDAMCYVMLAWRFLRWHGVFRLYTPRIWRRMRNG